MEQTDFLTFEQELLNTSREAIAFSKKYLEARKNASHCLNRLQTYINKAKLFQSKKSLENKIIELLANQEYGQQAEKLNEEMNNYEAEYKGLELVIKAYLAHCSALQSVLKVQQNGELTEAMKTKYNRQPERLMYEA